MRKFLFYILPGAVVVAFVLLFNQSVRPPKRLDERVTLKQKDKIPYGTSAARSLLAQLYPDAEITNSVNYPQWASSPDSHAAVIIIADHFDADEEDMLLLLDYLQHGNSVFLISNSFSADARKYFGFSRGFAVDAGQPGRLQLKLDKKYFPDDSFYSYPGFSFHQPLLNYSDSITTVLGTDAQGSPNFFRFTKGSGSIYVHTVPLAFSNYFILHKNNYRYFQQAMSVLPAPNKIDWNETFLQEPVNKNPDKGWLSGLLKHEAFRWSFYLGLLGLLMYALLEMRRKQRVVPAFKKPRNDSLDFIKTLGRLYYERGNHHDMARKLSIYFQEHVRTSYKISTAALDEEFIRSLYLKSSYPHDQLRSIVYFINSLSQRRAISENELAMFYQQLTLFYEKTGTWQKNYSKQERISQN